MILGIETSCDEIAAAVIDNTYKVQKNIIFTSSDLAIKTGGVVPEIAARDAGKKITTVLQKATENLNWNDIDAIAVTNGPGLVGSLLTGIEAAKTLAFLKNKPLIPVYHIYGHMCANLLDREENLPLNYPVLVLTVSGGHNDIYLWKSPLEREKIGQTIDDAAGECFDKCARMLGLPYPGGPHLSKCAESGNAKIFDFPRPMIHKKNNNFSFSGLKTSVLYTIRDLGGIENISKTQKSDISAGIQTAICETLLTKFYRAAKKYNVKEVHLTGGVSANTQLREEFLDLAKKQRYISRVPSKIIYSTDNAAMIAAAGKMIWDNTLKKDFPFEDVKVSF